MSPCTLNRRLIPLQLHVGAQDLWGAWVRGGTQNEGKLMQGLNFTTFPDPSLPLTADTDKFSNRLNTKRHLGEHSQLSCSIFCPLERCKRATCRYAGLRKGNLGLHVHVHLCFDWITVSSVLVERPSGNGLFGGKAGDAMHVECQHSNINMEDLSL